MCLSRDVRPLAAEHTDGLVRIRSAPDGTVLQVLCDQPEAHLMGGFLAVQEQERRGALGQDPGRPQG